MKAVEKLLAKAGYKKAALSVVLTDDDRAEIAALPWLTSSRGNYWIKEDDAFTDKKGILWAVVTTMSPDVTVPEKIVWNGRNDDGGTIFMKIVGKTDDSDEE